MAQVLAHIVAKILSPNVHWTLIKEIFWHKR